MVSYNDEITLTRGYKKIVTNSDCWTIPLVILDKKHIVKEVYTNKANVTWIYFGEKDINGNRIYVEDKYVKKHGE